MALLLAGCGQAPTAHAAEELPADAEESEYFVPTVRGQVSRAQAATTGVTHYFQTSRSRLCYSVRVPGTWELGREPALLRRLDGGALVGVQLLGLRELGADSVEDAIRIAAERSGKLYAPELGSAPWTLAPYARIPGAWQWMLQGERVDERRRLRATPRWYRAVGEDWIAQFTIGAARVADHDAFVDGVITSLTTSGEPRCFERELRELGGIRAR